MSEHQPISEEDHGRLTTFIEAAQAAAADWVEAELSPTTQYAAQIDHWTNDRSTAWLPLHTPPEIDRPPNPTALVVLMDPVAARRFADRAFMEVGIAPDGDLLADCVAEFANLIAGRAKALTSGTPNHFLLGVPTIKPPPVGSYLLATLAGEIGEVVVALKRA